MHIYIGTLPHRLLYPTCLGIPNSDWLIIHLAKQSLVSISISRYDTVPGLYWENDNICIREVLLIVNCDLVFDQS